MNPDSPLHSTSAPDAFELFARQHPEGYARLQAGGWEFAGDDVLGRCCGVATLYLELDTGGGLARGWVFDIVTNEFIGPSYEVTGPVDVALERARELIEITYTEDQMSGTAPRYQQQHVERLAA